MDLVVLYIYIGHILETVLREFLAAGISLGKVFLHFRKVAINIQCQLNYKIILLIKVQSAQILPILGSPFRRNHDAKARVKISSFRKNQRKAGKPFAP